MTVIVQLKPRSFLLFSSSLRESSWILQYGWSLASPWSTPLIYGLSNSLIASTLAAMTPRGPECWSWNVCLDNPDWMCTASVCRQNPVLGTTWADMGEPRYFRSCGELRSFLNCLDTFVSSFYTVLVDGHSGGHSFSCWCVYTVTLRTVFELFHNDYADDKWNEVV